MATRYEVLWTDDPLERYLLVDHESKARVALAPGRGGMVTRFRVGDDAVLFVDDVSLHDLTKKVRGGIPILFPFAGRLTGDSWQRGGVSHSMKQHGFARDLPWTVAGQSAERGAEVVLELEANDATLAQFPFFFRLSFTYTLRGRQLTIRQRFSNLDDQEMPIQPGLHPYFHLPDGRKAEAQVITDAASAWDNVARRATPVTGRIDLTAAEVDLHLLDHWPRSVKLIRPGVSDLELALGMDDKVLVVWTESGRDFVCLEPWTGPIDNMNRGQPIIVPPHSTHESSFSILACPSAAK